MTKWRAHQANERRANAEFVDALRAVLGLRPLNQKHVAAPHRRRLPFLESLPPAWGRGGRTPQRGARE